LPGLPMTSNDNPLWLTTQSWDEKWLASQLRQSDCPGDELHPSVEEAYKICKMLGMT
jgi:hypothetical protein